MRKFHFFSLVVISMMLVLGWSAGSALAKTGGVKVDADGTCDQDREENDISGDQLCIWLNLSSKNAENPSPVCVEFFNHDTDTETTVPDVEFDLSGCTDTSATYYLVCLDIGPPPPASALDLADGAYSIKVFENNDCEGNSIGGDTFELIP
jgi:hypothetical protein